MALQFFHQAESSPSGAGAGLFIPRTDLDGITSGEFGSGVSTAIKTAKATFALLATFKRKLDLLTDPLGVAVTYSKAVDTPTQETRYTYTITQSYLNDFSDSAIKVIPVPTTGTNNGVGDFAIEDIFSNAEVVSADGAIPGEGVLIRNSDINPFGAPTTPGTISTGNDNRKWFAGLFRWLAANSSVRATGTVSGITGASIGTPTRLLIPAAWYDATNPVSGLASADLNKYMVINVPYNVTVAVIENLQAQTLDVSVQ